MRQLHHAEPIEPLERDVNMSEDEPAGVYVPIRERPENTHIGWSGDDPAARSIEARATFDPTEDN